MNRLLLLLLALSASLALTLAQECPAEPCDAPEECQTPDCSCSGSTPPVPMLGNQRPQIVHLSFDDAITALSHTDYYTAIFNGTFTNPNGCPLAATHFLTHQSTDYSLAHRYWSAGHEIATHSITHLSNTTYWSTLDEQEWVDEICVMKNMINKYASIPLSEIQGMRAPFLQGGGDPMFAMMEDCDILYDSSMPSRVFGYDNLDNGMWPFTLDKEMTMDCQIEPCPTCSFPGKWEQPILDFEDNWYGSNPTNPDVGQPCSMLDSCIINTPTPDDVFDMLWKNFERSYNGNTRAPIGLYMHAAWFYGQDWHYQGYLKFLEEISDNDKYPDVWILPARAGIEYMKNPIPNDQILAEGFAPFDTTCTTSEPTCEPQSCQYNDVTYYPSYFNLPPTIYMTVCCPPGTADCCPPLYPWLGNPDGEALP